MSYVQDAKILNLDGEYVKSSQLKTELANNRFFNLSNLQMPFNTLADEMPSRDLCDVHKSQFMNTFNEVFQLIDTTTFQQAYTWFWEAPHSAPLEFVITLLLVICIGNSAAHPTSSRLPQTTVLRWYHFACTWQDTALESRDCKVETVQTFCLLALMRQTYSFNSNTGWITSGTLLRKAVTIGLHRDPSYLENIGPSESETHTPEVVVRRHGVGSSVLTG